jgi:protein phosphatase
MDLINHVSFVHGMMRTPGDSTPLSMDSDKEPAMTTPIETTDEDMARRPTDDDIDIFGLTHPGLVRKANQDHFLIASLRRQIEIHLTSLPPDTRWPAAKRLAFMAMVADGVGSTTAGEEAARLAVERVTEYVTQTVKAYYSADGVRNAAFSEALAEAAMQVHAAIVEHAKDDDERRSMATTLTLWIAIWPRAYLIQVGDSRCYIMREGKLMQISRDQTMAQELVDQGILSRTDAPRTRWANVLSSAIGGHQAAPVVTQMEQFWGQVGLLCSDGLTKHVSDERIAERLRTMTSARQVCQDLLQDALGDGGTDNITIIVGRMLRRNDA